MRGRTGARPSGCTGAGTHRSTSRGLTARLHGHTDARPYGCMNARTHGRTATGPQGHMATQTQGRSHARPHTDAHKDGRTDACTDGRTDGRTGPLPRDRSPSFSHRDTFLFNFLRSTFAKTKTALGISVTDIFTPRISSSSQTHFKIFAKSSKKQLKQKQLKEIQLKQKKLKQKHF